MWISPSLAPALTFVLIFIDVYPFFEILIRVSGSCLGLSGTRYLLKEGPGSGSLGCGPALMPVLTFSPRATVWLWLGGRVAVVPMTMSPVRAPAFTWVLIFILVFSFLEILK